MNLHIISFAVGCLNHDRTVMSRPFAWCILACLPILKGSACTNTSKDWDIYDFSRKIASFSRKIASFSRSLPFFPVTGPFFPVLLRFFPFSSARGATPHFRSSTAQGFLDLFVIRGKPWAVLNFASQLPSSVSAAACRSL